MTSAVGIVASSPVGTTPPAAATAVTSSTSSASTVAATNAAVSLRNPRVIQDPNAGFITQYLSSSGSIVMSQTPSLATVAYLRMGLGRDGEPKNQGAQIATTA